MDLKTLKLELLERIALIDDEARLLALKRMLDSPRGYGIPNEQLSVVKEGEETYQHNDMLMYSWEEVKLLLEEERKRRDNGDSISDEELAELDARHQARLSGASKGFTMEESLR
ncbi:MAG TPA: hypothetical protein VHL57_12160, partial [Flavobacteriales bacterium]|nr:hypothetical protein [Flavobacteriales bacterium]